MKPWFRILGFAALLMTAVAPPSLAQYMFIDSNGDGMHSALDKLNANGTATPVSIYLITNQNADGSTATCDQNAAQALDFLSYIVNLEAAGGTVSYTGFVNAQTTFFFPSESPRGGTTGFVAGYAGFTALSAGKHLLGTLTITGQSGNPAVNILPLTSDAAVGALSQTSFGTPCAGCAGDNTYVLNRQCGGVGPIDWTDVDGLAPNAAANQPPVLSVSSIESGLENSLVSISAGATDPDAANTLTISQTNNAAFLTTFSHTPSVSPASATLSGTPDFTQAGGYTIDWTVTDGAGGSDAKSTVLTIANTNRTPTLTAPTTVSGAEGSPVVGLTASATDPDAANVLTISQTNDAAFLTTFSHTPSVSPASATLSGTPDFTQAGSYTIDWSVSDGAGGSDAKSTALTVDDVNRAPVADADGPYTGVLNIPVSFDGSGSSDPDGNTLSYAWAFGDGGTASGPMPDHAYTSAGIFNVTLTVTDPGSLTDDDMTTATIGDFFQAEAFFVGGNKTTRLGAGKPYTCVQIEPVGGAFAGADVDFSSIVMRFDAAEIMAVSDKSALDSDKNRNGIQEFTACFTKDDLRTLFATLPAGDNTVDVTIEGALLIGGSFRAMTTHRVVSRGGALAARPNPLNPVTAISFGVSKTGRVRAEVFDLAGRLVETLVDQDLSPGVHEVIWDGTTRTGARVATGIYYVRVRDDEGTQAIRLTVLK